jgi:hypothetical protein
MCRVRRGCCLATVRLLIDPLPSNGKCLTSHVNTMNGKRVRMCNNYRLSKTHFNIKYFMVSTKRF